MWIYQKVFFIKVSSAIENNEIVFNILIILSERKELYFL